MRIQDKGPKADVTGPSAAGVNGAAHGKKAHGPKEGVGEGQGRDSVKVNVSAKARALAEQSTVDEAKVARLKEKLEKGELKIDARAIAAKLVGEDA